MSIIGSLAQILDNMPSSWRGTTFNNSNLLGRAGFADRLVALVKSGALISVDSLTAVGESEDYLRVASNVSTLLEMALAEKHGFDVEKVFTFASLHFQVIAVCLVATPKPVHLYLGGRASPFSEEQISFLSKLRCVLHVHEGLPSNPTGNDSVVLAYVSQGLNREFVDGLVENHALYIVDAAKISPAEVLVRRKRMATPMTTPAAETALREIAGLPIKHQPHPDTSSFFAHLQTMSGASNDPTLAPLCFTAGLPAIAALWSAVAVSGGADILMASTAYGGSSQLTDLMVAQTGVIKKHTFDVMGDISMEKSIEECFGRLNQVHLMPTTVLFIETPTNPDMKVPDMPFLAKLLSDFCKKHNSHPILLVDTTFAPASHVIAKMKQAQPDLNVVVFLSMSKSVSRGHTVAGALVFNEKGRDLHRQVHSATCVLDTSARPDQLRVLADNHVGVEDRCAKAYQVAVAVGSHLVDSVRSIAHKDMSLAFVSPATAASGFTTSTFSFNLPALVNGDNEALAQRFVDLLVAERKDLFKPCVSFGQDNGLVYCTVPATSTQGAIKAEDKAKQALGGVQLTRLSFPPTIDVDAVNHVIENALKKIYQ